MSGIGGGSGRRARGTRVSWSGLLVPVLVLSGFGWAGAQEKPASGVKSDLALKGTVVDATTGTPLAGAFVHLGGEEWGTLSASDGSFFLPRVEAGLRLLVVEQLGYVTLEKSLEVAEPREAVALEVEPDPILLEGVQVVLDRFERRRNATPTSSWVFDREALLTNVGVDALDYLEARTPIHLYPCSLGSECAVIRGRLTPVAVYVDEMPLLGGLDYLRSHQPYDLQRIEVYAGGQQIRVYTEGFLERAGKTRLQPIPFIM